VELPALIATMRMAPEITRNSASLPASFVWIVMARRRRKAPRTAIIEEHTNHKADSTGSQCVACHMPVIETEGPANSMVHAHTFRFIRSSTTAGECQS
jgi:hypothetical protein